MATLQQLTFEDLARTPLADPALPVYLGSMGAICHLTSVLCWEQYGYDGAGDPPGWASKALTNAKAAAKIVTPADCRYSVETERIGSEVRGTFRIWDEANRWAEPWSVNFAGYTSEESARKHYAGEFDRHRRLHTGSINALIHYQQTGEATLADWAPENQFYWRKPGYSREGRVFLKEYDTGING